MYRSSSHVQEQFTCTGVHIYRNRNVRGGERPDFDLFFIV